MELGVGGRCVGAESWFVRDSFIHVCLFTAMAVGLVTPEGSRLWGTSTRTRRRRQLIGSMVRLSSLPLEIDVCHLRVEVGLLFTCWVAACFVCRESGRRERDHGDDLPFALPYRSWMDCHQFRGLLVLLLRWTWKENEILGWSAY